jgi:hypothetical protein
VEHGPQAAGTKRKI